MKKILLLCMTAGIFLIACSSAENTPAAVKDSFAKQFPGTSVKWEKEDGNYEAVFTWEKKEMSTVYDSTGRILESETEIAVTELPETAKNYISAHYNGAVIKEASKITLADGSIQYEAALKEKDVIFDANGNFVKEAKE